MLRTLLPLAVLGFAVYLLIDTQAKFKKLQKDDPEAAYEYRRSHALLMTLLVMLVIVILYATYKGFMTDFAGKSVSVNEIVDRIRRIKGDQQPLADPVADWEQAWSAGLSQNGPRGPN